MPLPIKERPLAIGWTKSVVMLSDGSETASELRTHDIDIPQEGGRADRVPSRTARRGALPGDLILRVVAPRTIRILVAIEITALAGRNTFRGRLGENLETSFARHWLLLAPPSPDALKRDATLSIHHPIAIQDQLALSAWFDGVTARLDSLSLRAATIERLRRSLPIQLRPPSSPADSTRLKALRKALTSMAFIP